MFYMRRRKVLSVVCGCMTSIKLASTSQWGGDLEVTHQCVLIFYFAPSFKHVVTKPAGTYFVASPLLDLLGSRNPGSSSRDAVTQLVP